MEIRLATSADYKRIATALRNKAIEYITPAHAREDIARGQLYLIIEDGAIIGQCALVYEPYYQYHAIKRLTIYNQRNYGRGIAQQFISFFCGMNLPALGCTPWTDNARMRYLLEKNGFSHQYTFLDCYEFYKKSS
jgi:RimJ/RimL family protein N-acetyltransferase